MINLIERYTKTKTTLYITKYVALWLAVNGSATLNKDYAHKYLERNIDVNK